MSLDEWSLRSLGRFQHRISLFALAAGQLLLLLLLSFSVRNNASCLRGLIPYDNAPEASRRHSLEPRSASLVVTSNQASKHIVVAHCKENLAWLDQLAVYDPAICRRIHIHIYSKCGANVDLKAAIPAVAECATLHRLMNFGTQEYAYFRYIEDLYDNLPPLVSFVQGGGLTENPHLLYDLAGPDPPGLTYRGLTRHVRWSWHFIKYDTVEERGEADIVSKYFEYLKDQRLWLSDWRSMFTASRTQIRRNPWSAYVFINNKLAHEDCKSVNCMTENLFSSFLGCNPIFFDKDRPDCTSGVYANLANVVIEEDYIKDGLENLVKEPANDTEWRTCGSRTILYSMSPLNGALVCLENGNTDGTVSAEANRILLKKMIDGDRWVADLSTQSFGQEPEWFRHEENLDAQNREA